MSDQQATCWAGKPAKERREYISQYVAFTPGLTAAVAVVGDLYDTWREAPEGEISFIQGETRAGKTTALDEFIVDKHEWFSKHYEGRKDSIVQPLGEDPAFWAIEIETPKGFLRPIVKVQVSKKPKYKSLFADVLATMGFKKIPDSMTSDERLKLMTTQMGEQQTHFIAFDEVHHISEYKDPEGAYDAGDVFKIVAKNGRAGVLCVGLPRMMELVDANEQVRELVRAKHTVEPFNLDLDPSSDLKQFMTAMNQQMPFDQPSCLDQDDIVLRIALMNDLFTGRIAKFIHRVVGYAISVGASCVDLQTLVQYVRLKLEIKDDTNIFLIARDAISEYPALMEKERKERKLLAEKRRAKAAQQHRTKPEFGARGQ
jgi:hypothetical protein